MQYEHCDGDEDGDDDDDYDDGDDGDDDPVKVGYINNLICIILLQPGIEKCKIHKLMFRLHYTVDCHFLAIF